MSNFWKLNIRQSFCDASQSTEAIIAAFSQDNKKKKREIELEFKQVLSFEVWRVSYCNVPLDISASFDSPELCL